MLLMQQTNSVMSSKANNQEICVLTYFQAEYTRDMEEHAHGAGDSTQPAAPRVGTLHAIPPTMVRLLDLQNSITVEPLHNGQLEDRRKWPS